MPSSVYGPDPGRAVSVVRRSFPGAGLRVLDHVGERLGAEEVDARLDRLRESPVSDVQANRQGKPVGQRVEGGGQAAKGQDRWVDARGDLAQARMTNSAARAEG
jgi:hypothetical protein